MNYDARTTRRFLERTDYVEKNDWLYGKRPSMKRMMWTNVPVFVGAGAISYYTKQKLEKDNVKWPLWAAPQAVFVSTHLYAARGNVKLVDKVTR